MLKKLNHFKFKYICTENKSEELSLSDSLIQDIEADFTETLNPVIILKTFTHDNKVHRIVIPDCILSAVF